MITKRPNQSLQPTAPPGHEFMSIVAKKAPNRTIDSYAMRALFALAGARHRGRSASALGRQPKNLVAAFE